MPSEFRISSLCELLERYLEPDQISEVYQAYLFAAEAHEGQQRLSGEPYITHPIAVAKILAEMYMDPKSIVAAILHDVMEDTGTPKEQVVERFGEEVAELVDGVSKLTHIHFESKAEAQAENFRKMMLAMVEDIRVILIKLADRQRPGHHGRRPPLRHHGQSAVSPSTRHGNLRRRRLHDEQPGDGDRGPPQAQPGGAGDQRQRLRHDPLETGGGRLSRLGTGVQQS